MNSETLNTDLLAQTAFNSAKSALLSLQSNDFFNEAIAEAFGESISDEQVRNVLSVFVKVGWPALRIASSAELTGAKAAYSSQTDTIYLSRDFISTHASDTGSVVNVLIEELTHAIDARLNPADSAGDEGAIFAAYVMGTPPSAAALAALHSENDHGSITIDGVQLSAEFATQYGAITLDGALADWTAASRLDNAASGVVNYQVFGKVDGGAFVFALQSNVAIGANSTFWLNTDQNKATGFQIFGFAGGAEYNVNIAADGTLALYAGSAGQTLVGAIDYAFNADRRILEFAIPQALLSGAPTQADIFVDVNDSVYLPNDYSFYTYTVAAPSNTPPAVVGTVTLDGSLTADWTSADRIDAALGAAGYELYGKVSGSSYVFAFKAPSAIGAGTTAWLNIDQNSATGYKIFGFAGGVEYALDFDGAGVPKLYSVNATSGALTLVNANVQYGYSADKTIVEFAVASSAIGSPNALNTLVDLNNATYLPADYSQLQYAVATPNTNPPTVVGAVTIDGAITTDWTIADRVDTAFGAAGYEIYGKVTGNSYVFALKAPAAIGFGTTAWINSDQNSATGYKIFGFAGGAEYAVEFDGAGAPKLYSVNATSGALSLVDGALPYAYSADKTAVEFAVVKTDIGSPNAIGSLIDINNAQFLPTDYSQTQYVITTPPTNAPIVGSVTLDGSLAADWSAANRIDISGTGIAGYEIYGKATGDSFVIALKAPVAIGGGSTVWLNTDQNAATGYQIFTNSGGAEYAVEFDAQGAPKLYSVNASTGALTLVNGGLLYGYSADKTVVEFAVQKAAVGSPIQLDTLYDVNNAAFLPQVYVGNQYTIVDTAQLPARTDFSHKVAIVYSETTAKAFFSETAYADLFMSAQNQARMAGAPYDILTETDLKSLGNLVNYDAIIFPSMSNVKAADAAIIETNLKLLSQNYNTSFITSGDFMTGNESGGLLPGDPYARMKALFDITRVNGGFPNDVTLQASTDVSHPILSGYSSGELIRTYTGVAWSAYGDATPGVTAPTVIDTQTINGVTYNAVLAETVNGDRNVHFSTASVMADNNQLSQAIEWAVGGAGIGVGLQITRNAGVFASRTDMDFSQYTDAVIPSADNGNSGVYDKLLPVLSNWMAQYNFVGSFYVNVGNYPNATENGPEQTNWAISKAYYDQLRAMGNEIGSHSYTHPFSTNLLLKDNFTDAELSAVKAGYQALGAVSGSFTPYALRADASLTIINQLAGMSAAQVRTTLASAEAAVAAGANPATLDAISKAILESSFTFQFSQSESVINQQLGITIQGAAIPGANENLQTSLAVLQYYNYLTGGYVSTGSGFPGAIGSISPTLQSKVYIAPNVTFDNTLISFQGLSTAQAEAFWSAEWARLVGHAETPIIVMPWHDYGVTQLDDPDYQTSMYTNYIARAATYGVEFVTLADLAKRITSQEQATVNYSVAGSVITASVTSTDAGKFALDLDNLSAQQIKSVANWYAYDNDSVFTARNGGSFTITVGATADDVTHITKVAQRAELVSLSGNGTNLSFQMIGSGEVDVALKTVAGQSPIISGAQIVAQNGSTATLQLGTNLIANGSFENPAIGSGVGVQVTPALVSSWNNTGGTVIEVWRNLNGISATNGQNLIELDAAGGVDTIVQSVTTAAGQFYSLSVDLRGRTSAATSTVEIWWAGSRIATVDPSITAWTTSDYVVQGTGGAANLEFREVAADNDGVGAFIDNVRLYSVSSATHNVSITYGTPNSAPVITSSGGGLTGAVSMAENLTAAVTVTSTDADAAQTRTYSLMGGVDANLFAINAASGALTFKSAPNFEAPSDSGTNNVYDVVVGVTDSQGASDAQALAITVTNVNGQTFNGTAGNDTINGTSENDTINGNAGNDTLNGGAGNDTINGGAGFDVMTGGAGSDTFAFGSIIGDIGNGTTAGTRDTIADFVHLTDRINLSAIDANTALLAFGDQAFNLLPTQGAAFTAAAQLHYIYQTINGVQHTIIEGNVNSNLAADFRIDLVGQIAITSADFFL